MCRHINNSLSLILFFVRLVLVDSVQLLHYVIWDQWSLVRQNARSSLSDMDKIRLYWVSYRQDVKRRSVPHSEVHGATATARYPIIIAINDAADICPHTGKIEMHTSLLSDVILRRQKPAAAAAAFSITGRPRGCFPRFRTEYRVISAVLLRKSGRL